MDSRQIWTIVGISLVVAVISSFATTSITGAVSWPWQQPQPIAISNIRANSCDADSSCEITNANIGGGRMILQREGWIRTGADIPLLLDSGTDYVVIADGLNINGKLSGHTNDYLMIDDDIQIINSELQNPYRMTIDKDGIILTGPDIPLRLRSGTGNINFESSDIWFTHLAGNGTAYLCLNSLGVTFRSLTPCV